MNKKFFLGALALVMLAAAMPTLVWMKKVQQHPMRRLQPMQKPHLPRSSRMGPQPKRK